MRPLLCLDKCNPDHSFCQPGKYKILDRPLGEKTFVFTNLILSTVHLMFSINFVLCWPDEWCLGISSNYSITQLQKSSEQSSNVKMTFEINQHLPWTTCPCIKAQVFWEEKLNWSPKSLTSWQVSFGIGNDSITNWIGALARVISDLNMNKCETESMRIPKYILTEATQCQENKSRSESPDFLKGAVLVLQHT